MLVWFGRVLLGRLRNSLLMNQKWVPHGTTQPWRICGLCFCIRYPFKLTLEEFLGEDSTMYKYIYIYAYIS